LVFSSLAEQGGDVAVSHLRGNFGGRSSRVADEMGISSLGQQDSRQIAVAEIAGPVQRRIPQPVFLVDIHAFCQQGVDSFNIVVPDVSPG